MDTPQIMRRDMTGRPDPAVLAESPLGSELEPAQCRTLANAMTARRLSEGEVLLEEGHIDDSLHLIVGGALAVTRNVAGGGWVLLQLLRRGDIAGEMGFLDAREHTATLRATGATEIYSLRRQAFEALVEQHPVLVYRVMRAIVRSVHAILLRMNLEYVELTNYITKQHGRY